MKLAALLPDYAVLPSIAVADQQPIMLTLR
jgi:hypothetical protein